MPEWHSSIERGCPLGGRPAIGIALRNKNREPSGDHAPTTAETAVPADMNRSEIF
jgi:hypothetical protein